MLTGDEIRRRGIIADASLPERQFQPNGVDLTLDCLWRIAGGGTIPADPDKPTIPQREVLVFDHDGWVSLPTGTYALRYREETRFPTDCGGLVFPRSSLLRMGVFIPTAVWDAGYNGRGESLMVVLNTEGVRVRYGARVAQLVVFLLTGETIPYSGTYQRENLLGPSRGEE